ncbi:alpha-hydroxy-acid oxidizing protein [Fructobacillus papyriferae]|uniref:alpha-hydroxy-acid oxidizing protein n=1 Tax=Fructobacillus papyriferae TaxID=2713171 RepID=UPI003B75C400
MAVEVENMVDLADLSKEDLLALVDLALAYQDGKAAPTLKRAVKTMILPTALANVRALRQRLNKSIAIIGTGGITSGADVFAHILCGADMVSVGTQVIKEGLGVYDRLTEELQAIMTEKGYERLSDFRGQLREL